MHYYQFNIADYRKDTVHLTPLEHYIYRTLIDWYYLDEKPIPNETEWVLRRLGLGLKDNENLQNVLSDFFINIENQWHHTRIDSEIINYHSNAEKNRRNGKLGGRPLKTQSVILGNPIKSENNPNQEPRTNNHKPKTNIKYIPQIPAELLSDFMAIRKAKRLGEVTKTAFAGLQREAEKAGLSVEQAITISVERGWGSFKASWDWQDKPSRQNQREADKQWFIGEQLIIEKEVK